MAKKVYTGNDFLDRLTRGPYVENPNYNPKTKAGKSQPSVLIDTSAGNLFSGALTNTANKIKKLQFTSRDLGRTLEDVERDEELGITLSPYNSEEDLNKARANSQSSMSKIGNAIMQAGVGEIILGTLEGFGNIADGVINTFTGDNYGKNAYTELMSEAKENLNNKFQIYRENPDEDFDFSDLGWWAQGLVSTATTLSLLLPAAGWAKGLSYLGKVSRANKLLSSTNKWLSRGIAGASKANKVNNKYGILKSVSNKANRIENTINYGSGILAQSLISRTGENYMEAKAIYDEVYQNSLDNLNGMIESDKQNNTKEFQKFIENNSEFKNEDGSIMSVDDIAKEIARKSANKTFYNDYAMLFMDVMQFKALGKLWGRTGQRATTASERIVAENVKRRLAGKTEEELIKDNIINNTKEKLKYALNKPLTSIQALELGEGFEEMYQGIQSEKGLEVVTKYFDPNMTPTTISSYLSDSSIWEQGFWGTLGAKVFSAGAKGLQKASKQYEAFKNKKHMTAEEYKQWKQGNDNVYAKQLEGFVNDTDEYINNMKLLEEGKNHFNCTIDPETGQEIIKDGTLEYEDIDDTQKDYLRDKAIDKFITNATLRSVDNGTFDLLHDIVSGEEFDQYLTKNGAKITSEDKALSKQIANRMSEIADIYNIAIKDLYDKVDITNPYVTIAAAHSITRNKLKVQDYDDIIANINSKLEYTDYEEMLRYRNIHKHINNIKNKLEEATLKYNRDEISRAAYNQIQKDLNKNLNKLIEYAENKTLKGSLEVAGELVKKELEHQAIDSFIDTITKYINEITTYEVPSNHTLDLINKKIDAEIKKAYTSAKIPENKQEFDDLYDEFSRSMDEVYKKRKDEYYKIVENYLNNAENIDVAINNIYRNTTGNKKVNEALQYLRYMYEDSFYGDDIINNTKINLDQIETNLIISSLIDKAKNKRNKVEEVVQEAEEQGVVLPDTTIETTENDDIDSNNIETNTEVYNINEETQTEIQTEAQTETSPSTGGQIITKPVKTEDIVDTTGHDTDINPMEVDNIDKENEVQEYISRGYNTNELKADLAARQYIMQIGFKEEDRIKEIANDLKNNNEEKFIKLINEVINFLVSKGYDKNLASSVTKKAIYETINMFGALNNKSAFAQLAQQLAIGFSKQGAKRYSITELITGSDLNNIIDEFLTEYVKLVDNPTINGKYIINVQSLFEYILKNKDIDAYEANYIYNNIQQFIATNDNSKYVFTGFNTTKGLVLSSKEFLDRLKEDKAQLLLSINELHISPVEIKNNNKDYKEALIQAHNGARTFVKEQKDSNNNISNINVYVEYKKGKEIKTTKVGILRAVHYDKNGVTITPNSHYSGFKNEVTKTDNDYILDCDKLFNAIINKDTEDGMQLFNDIAEYYLKVQDIINNKNKGNINAQKAKEELDKIMSEELAYSILSNSLTKEVFDNNIYIPYNTTDDIAKARNFAKTVASILFYGSEDVINDPANANINRFASDKETLTNRYNIWRKIVYNNYSKTYEIQKVLTNNNEIDTKLNVSFYTIPIKSEKPVNIKDLDFNLDRNTTDKSMPYTPFVMCLNGHLIDEYGNDYGNAELGIQEYSVGYIVYNEDGLRYTAYANKAVNIADNPIKNDITNEFYNIIKQQINNINPDTHNDTFLDIKNKLIELFGYGGIFKLGNIEIKTDKGNNFITLYDKSTNKNIITFHSIRKNGDRSNAITIYNEDNSTTIFNSLENDKDDKIINSINNVTDKLFSTIYINRSKAIFNKTTKSGGKPKYFKWENNKFILNINNNEITYNNYGDFILQNGGFTTDIVSENGTFVQRIMNQNRITIDLKAREELNININNSKVSDNTYTKDRNPKRKTIDTKDLLEYAGVSQEKIDILTGKNSGIPIVTKRIYISEQKGDANMYFDNNDKTIHLTPKGAEVMNNNPNNTLRLILHENIHRLFNSKNYTNKERERIINELEDVYNFTREQIENDFNNGNLSENLYRQFNNVLDKTQSYETREKRLEEFLTECLTQAKLIEYLNNTQYEGDADIKGINQEKKSILQKIIDIILDLFGITDNRIKNNSILVKEYIILSKGSNPTSISFTRTDSKSLPVEGNAVNKPTTDNKTLNETKDKLNEVIDYFKENISRSENFEEDHTYYINGKKVDYSVTQFIHGKQDIGEVGIPASMLGNTADELSRIYFENNGVWPNDISIPNVNKRDTENIKQEVETIKKYLDSKFGENKYGVITSEFPIGATIEINGENKTIAGTMDMIVYTDNGDIYIFDFKTKRIKDNGDTNIDEITLAGYKKQVNIYRQILETNFSELKGRIKIGGLIKFNTEYPLPTDTIKYRKSSKVKNQIEISLDGGNTFENIQDSVADYSYPMLYNDFNDTNTFIPIEVQNIDNKIYKIESKETEETDITFGVGDTEINNEVLGLDSDGYIINEESLDLDDLDDVSFASTEIITDNVEIYASAIADNSNNNMYGVKLANNMTDFINQFPEQYRQNIAKILDSNELNYTCQ